MELIDLGENLLLQLYMNCLLGFSLSGREFHFLYFGRSVRVVLDSNRNWRLIVWYVRIEGGQIWVGEGFEGSVVRRPDIEVARLVVHVGPPQLPLFFRSALFELSLFQKGFSVLKDVGEIVSFPVAGYVGEIHARSVFVDLVVYHRGAEINVESRGLGEVLYVQTRGIDLGKGLGNDQVLVVCYLGRLHLLFRQKK